MLLGQELKFKNKLCNLKLGTFFSALPGLGASALSGRVASGAVGPSRPSGRAASGAFGPSGINVRKEEKRPGGDITSAEARHFHAHSMK